MKNTILGESRFGILWIAYVIYNFGGREKNTLKRYFNIDGKWNFLLKSLWEYFFFNIFSFFFSTCWWQGWNIFILHIEVNMWHIIFFNNTFNYIQNSMKMVWEKIWTKIKHIKLDGFYKTPSLYRTYGIIFLRSWMVSSMKLLREGRRFTTYITVDLFSWNIVNSNFAIEKLILNMSIGLIYDTAKILECYF